MLDYNQVKKILAVEGQDGTALQFLGFARLQAAHGQRDYRVKI